MTPLFDAALRDHDLVVIPRPLGSLEPPRIEPLPPLVTMDEVAA